MGRTFAIELDNIFQMKSLFANKYSYRLAETIHRRRLNSTNVSCYKKGDSFFFLMNQKTSVLTFQHETFKSLTYENSLS